MNDRSKGDGCDSPKPPHVVDLSALPEIVGSAYPAPFSDAVRTRARISLGDAAGLTQFGVNRVRIPPGVWSSQRHWHSHEDELVYILEGELVLVTDAGEKVLRAGDVAGFAAGDPDGHHLQNRSAHAAVFLAVGSRHPEDRCEYPDIDLRCEADATTGATVWSRKDGRRY